MDKELAQAVALVKKALEDAGAGMQREQAAFLALGNEIELIGGCSSYMVHEGAYYDLLDAIGLNGYHRD